MQQSEKFISCQSDGLKRRLRSRWLTGDVAVKFYFISKRSRNNPSSQGGGAVKMQSINVGSEGH